MNNKIWGIILAAGFSRRMGTAKLLLPFKSKSILGHVIEHGLNSGLSGISVVVNPDIPDLLTEAMVPGIQKVILNEKASEGMSSSIKLGLLSLPSDTTAALFLLGDMPLITTREIDRVIQDYSKHTELPLIVQSSYKNQKGHPVLFDRRLFSELHLVDGDEGGKSIIKKYEHQVYYSKMEINLTPDIDTQTDYQELLREEVS
ncbi:NTP transferase domain-containing protein [Peribacillus sp. SCS-37]|uniref:nucleotidyltransferase family protein n=1 Tax=Paraperibacillus esterisolvens TaxID=3115296 RepID=UPI003906B4A2